MDKPPLDERKLKNEELLTGCGIIFWLLLIVAGWVAVIVVLLVIVRVYQFFFL